MDGALLPAKLAVVDRMVFEASQIPERIPIRRILAQGPEVLPRT